MKKHVRIIAMFCIFVFFWGCGTEPEEYTDYSGTYLYIEEEDTLANITVSSSNHLSGTIIVQFYGLYRHDMSCEVSGSIDSNGKSSYNMKKTGGYGDTTYDVDIDFSFKVNSVRIEYFGDGGIWCLDPWTWSPLYDYCLASDSYTAQEE